MYDFKNNYLKAIEFYDKYKYPDAEQKYRELLTESLSVKNWEYEILATIGIGNVLRRYEQQEKAIDEFNKANELAEKALAEAEKNSQESSLKEKCEALDQCRVLIAKALIGRGRALRAIGKNHESLGSHMDAIQAIRDSNPNFSKVTLARANAYIGVGDALQHSDLISEALIVYSKAIGHISSGLASLNRDKKKNQPGVIDANGEATKTVDGQNIQIINQIDTERLVRQFSQARANAYIGSGDTKKRFNLIDEAIKDYTRALEECEANASDRVKLKASRSRGIAYLKQNDESSIEYADKDFDNAIEICKKCPHCLAHANALMGKGHVFRQRGKYDDALNYFQAARDKMQFTQHQKAYATALIGMAETQELQIWHSEELCQAKRDRMTACSNNFNLAIMLGRKIGCGFAIIRGQAGLRRQRNAEVKCSVDCTFRNDTHRTVKNCMPTIPKLATAGFSVEEKSILSIKGRIEKIFGADALRKFPTTIKDVEVYYHSFLPNYDARTWMVSMMCDIRGYTSIMSQAPPEEQFNLLDRFLKRVTQIIQKNGGGVDKYMGDAVLGFYLPTTLDSDNVNEECRKNTVVAAIRASLEIVNDPEIRSCFSLFANTKGIRRDDKEKLGIGIGIAHGLAKFGEIGASSHREYTAIGQPVNFSARLQQLATPWSVVCAEECWCQLFPDGKSCKKYDDANDHFKISPLSDKEKEMKGFEGHYALEVTYSPLQSSVASNHENNVTT